MKYEERLEARKLRKEEGLSLKDIAEKLGVAKSSVSLWVRDVALTEEQTAKLAENSNHYKQDGCRWSKINEEKRLEFRRQGSEKVTEDIDIFVAGCILYWAEGAKNKNVVKLSNTDLDLLKLFKRFLLECFNVCPSDFRIHIHCYTNNGLTVNEIEKYWIEHLELPDTCLRKTVVIKKHPMSKGYKKNKHKYGVCSLGIYKTEIVQQIFGGIEKIIGGRFEKGL